MKHETHTMGGTKEHTKQLSYMRPLKHRYNWYNWYNNNNNNN